MGGGSAAPWSRKSERVQVVEKVLLVAWLVALQPLISTSYCAEAQVIAGGFFSKAAGSSSDVPDTNKLALWQGTEDGTIRRWRAVAKGVFPPSDLVHVSALAFAPASGVTQNRPALFVGGTFRDSIPRRAALLRLVMAGPLEEPEDFRFFCKEGDPRTTHASVFALQTSGGPSSPEDWVLFVGGDFTWSPQSTSCKATFQSGIEPRYVARYKFDNGEWETLPPDDSNSGAGAPDSPVHMLAFDEEFRVLYVGGRSGPIRKYRAGTWSVLEPPVGIGHTARPLAILFDSTLGLGFLSFAGAAGQEAAVSGQNGIRVFTRGPEADSHERAADRFPHLQDSSVHFSALVEGTSQGRQVVFAAGNDSHCPALWLLPLDGLSPAGWQSRSLSSRGPCASLDIQGEDIVQALAFVEESQLLILAGDFYRVSEKNVSNIALSRDGGRSWSSLIHENEGLGEGLRAELHSKAVRVLLAIPQLDVTSAEPSNASPLGDALITLHGSGFTSVPGPGRKDDLGLSVGDTRCALEDWVSNSMVTCRLRPGFGANLLVEARLSGGKHFTRKGAIFSYSSPILGNDGVLSVPVSVSVGGESRMTILGRHFGVDANQVYVSVGQSACGSPQWLSDSSLSCTVAPGGFAAGQLKTRELPVTAEIGGRVAVSSGMNFSYSPPAVTHVHPSLVPTTGMAQGCVTLLGESFGRHTGLMTSVVVGSTDCLVSASVANSTCAGWISDTSVSCQAPGEGVGFIPMAVQVGFESWAQNSPHSSSIFKYAPPKIIEIMADNLPPPSGSGKITILGSGFGPMKVRETVLRKVYLGASECSKVDWVGHDRIICETAPGAGDKLHLRVEVAGQVAKAEQELKYQDPVLRELSPLLLPRDGGFKVTVRGSFFTSVWGLGVLPGRKV